MATERRIIQCTVCQTRIATRTLIGRLDRHPILLACPKCQIDISGEIRIDHEKLSFEFKFINATDVSNIDRESAEYYAEISGELLTEKIQSLPDGKIPPFYSPMFTAIDEMGSENFLQYGGRIAAFIEFTRTSWPTLKRVNELWANGQHEFCAVEIRKLLPEDRYPLNNDLEILRAIKHLNVCYFGNILPAGFLDRDAQAILDAVLRLVTTQGPQFQALSKRFAAAQKFRRYRNLFIARIEHFIQTFPHLIPVFSAPYHQAAEEDVLKKKGIFTANVRTIGQFYIDSYENIIEMSDGIIALNNLTHRGDFQAMPPIRKDVKTLDDYDRLQKGERLRFLISDTEDFGDCLGSYLDNKVRNSIGHGNTRFEPITQRLDFYSGIGQETPSVTMNLAEFANHCRLMLGGIFRVMEINSWIERVFLMSAGQRPGPLTAWKENKNPDYLKNLFP